MNKKLIIIIFIIIIVIGLLSLKSNNKKEEEKTATKFAATTFNHKYTIYEGTNKTKNEINSLLSNIFENNQRANSYKVNCFLLGEKITDYSINNLKPEQNKLVSDGTYTVSFEYDKNGIIYIIMIDLN